MWFDTLILQLRLHMAYRVNGILYRLRFLRLPYENSFARPWGWCWPSCGRFSAYCWESSCIWRCFSPLPCC